MNERLKEGMNEGQQMLRFVGGRNYEFHIRFQEKEN